MKKLLCCMVSVLIVLGVLTGCVEEGPVKNEFLEAATGKTFSMTFEELFAAYNDRIGDESQKIVGARIEESLEKATSFLFYPSVYEESIFRYSLIVDSTTHIVYEVRHWLEWGVSDEIEREQWRKRVEALILSVDRDMDQKGCEKLMKKLGLLNKKTWKKDYFKSIQTHGIRYTFKFDFSNWEEIGGRAEFSCSPIWEPPGGVG